MIGGRVSLHCDFQYFAANATMWGGDQAMTVGELRKALEGIPDDMPVGAFDEGDFISADISAGVKYFAPIPGRGATLHAVWEHSGHPPGTKGEPFFMVG
jgi:hypothetical protein